MSNAPATMPRFMRETPSPWPTPNPPRRPTGATLFEPNPSQSLAVHDAPGRVVDQGATKHDGAKPRYDLLPFEALDTVAAVFAFGAAKYGDHNWRKGMNWSRLAAAALRHIGAHMCGENLDPESQLPHLAHAACCVLMLLSYMRTRTGVDDRFTHRPAQ